MSEHATFELPPPTPEKINKTVANLRSLLKLYDDLSQVSRSSDFNLIMDQIKSEDQCEGEINNLMNIWIGDYACDPSLIIDQLSSEERANLYLTVVPPWIYPDSMRKLLDAIERPRNAAAEVACL
jgi:hypothetical protein